MRKVLTVLVVVLGLGFLAYVYYLNTHRATAPTNLIPDKVEQKSAPPTTPAVKETEAKTETPKPEEKLSYAPEGGLTAPKPAPVPGVTDKVPPPPPAEKQAETKPEPAPTLTPPPADKPPTPPAQAEAPKPEIPAPVAVVPPPVSEPPKPEETAKEDSVPEVELAAADSDGKVKFYPAVQTEEFPSESDNADWEADESGSVDSDDSVRFYPAAGEGSGSREIEHYEASESSGGDIRFYESDAGVPHERSDTLRELGKAMGTIPRGRVRMYPACPPGQFSRSYGRSLGYPVRPARGGYPRGIHTGYGPARRHHR